MENVVEKKPRKILAVLVVLVLIILLPLGSLVMNVIGAKQGQSFYANLKNNYGAFPAFSATTLANDTINAASFDKTVRIISFATDSSQSKVYEVIRPIMKIEQFREEVDNLRFITFDDSKDSVFTRDVVAKFNPKDREVWEILRGGTSLKPLIKLPNEFTACLVDTAGNIRNYYDLREPSACKLLVEHIAVMPIKNKKQVEKKDQKNM